MARGPCTFRKQDATRLVEAIKAAGLGIARVDLGKDGKITVWTGSNEPPDSSESDQSVNEWDGAT